MRYYFDVYICIISVFLSVPKICAFDRIKPLYFSLCAELIKFVRHDASFYPMCIDCLYCVARCCAVPCCAVCAFHFKMMIKFRNTTLNTWDSCKYFSFCLASSLARSLQRIFTLRKNKMMIKNKRILYYYMLLTKSMSMSMSITSFNFR